MDSYCELEQVPIEVKIHIIPMDKVEKIVTKLQTYKRAGVQVIKISGCLNKLTECPEILSKLSKDVSIFVDEPSMCPKCIRKYIENAE